MERILEATVSSSILHFFKHQRFMFSRTEPELNHHLILLGIVRPVTFMYSIYTYQCFTFSFNKRKKVNKNQRTRAYFPPGPTVQFSLYSAVGGGAGGDTDAEDMCIMTFYQHNLCTVCTFRDLHIDIILYNMYQSKQA